MTKASSDNTKSEIFNLLVILNKQELDNFSDFDQSTIYYHVSCLNDRKYQFKKQITPKKSPHSISKRPINLIAFEKLTKNLTETVIEKDEIRPLSDIYSTYKAIFEEEKLQSNSDANESMYQSQYLLEKILQSIPTVTKTVYKQRTYVHKAELTLAEIYKKGFENKIDWSIKIKEVAFYVRQCVMSTERKCLPKNNINLQDILRGECEYPKELILLVGNLLKGPNGTKSAIKEKKVESISSSIVLAMSNGNIKPALAIQLGMGMKSLTGSRKVIDILNRMGHSICYSSVEEIETELAYSGSMRKLTLPEGLIPHHPDLRTHLAFDNYDRYVETFSGKDTLHDTVGIVYQNIDPTITLDHLEVSLEGDTALQNGKRRRNYTSNFDSSVVPYSRKKKLSPALIGNQPALPNSLQTSLDMETIWMLTYALACKDTKRWCAWNAERVVDINPMQKIGYLPNINESPTSDAVVKKTLEVAQCVANECNQEHIIVTFDLAIAMMAYRIQKDLAPNFDNIFITLGAFHTELSYFKVS